MSEIFSWCGLRLPNQGGDGATYQRLTGYANPDAVTSIGNGSATTTYAYDNNGNLISSILGATTTLYTYDYANRLIKTDIGANSATTSTTYAYDAFGNRVFQGTGTATTTYPMKYYSIFATLSGATTTATTTEYIWGGDTLLSYIEQALTNGSPAASSTTYYVHPDHLGSVNVISDQNENPIATKDYFPYGALRVNSGSASLGRGYISQFEDTSGLDYENARYYDSVRGQFTSEDPVFLGSPLKQNLSNPQALNSYAYSDDNPVTISDPSGLLGVSSIPGGLIGALQSLVSALQGLISILQNPSGTGQGIGNSIKSFASNPVQNTSNYVNNYAQTFNSSSDYNQGRMIGSTIFTVASMFATDGLGDAADAGKLGQLGDDALVVRGGGLANQTAEKIGSKLGPSRTPGVNGFSVQCNGTCTDLGQLGQALPNSQISAVTAGDIRAAGGEVIRTPGIGYHATVTGLTGEQASQLPWIEYINPNPLQR